MSSTDFSSADQGRGRCFGGDMRLCRGGHWSGANIAAMVLGFVLFPPLGFVVLVWTILGHPIQELPGWVRDKWSQTFGSRPARQTEGGDNVVFNQYQQTQYDRIREIKDEIRRRAEAFRSFRSDAKRRQDQREFDEFMSSGPERPRDEPR